MNLEEIRNKKILYAALNWGMGHVSRSIGLIERLLSQENEILIACHQEQQAIFKEYFPNINFLELPPYPFNFRGKGNFSWDLLRNFNSLSQHKNKELKKTQRFIEKHSVDLIISDHRYGFRNMNIPSVFVTHQLQLPIRWWEKPVQWWHNFQLKKFNHIWVMDFEDSRLAGKLSQNKNKLSCTYIGPFSRFQNQKSKNQTDKTILIASGPDIYAQQLVEEASTKQLFDEIICKSSLKINASIERISGNWKEMDEEILSCKKIISRSGYSTILDNYFLQKELTMIPTKGQREQEYLFLLKK